MLAPSRARASTALGQLYQRAVVVTLSQANPTDVTPKNTSQHTSQAQVQELRKGEKGAEGEGRKKERRQEEQGKCKYLTPLETVLLEK